MRYQSPGGPLIHRFKEGLGLVRERGSHAGAYIETDSLLKEFHRGSAQ